MNRPVQRFWNLVQAQLGVLLHQRVAWIIALAVLALVGGSLALRGFNFGEAEPRFLINFALGATSLGGVLLAALGGPALFFAALETRVAELYFLRGVRRSELITAQVAALAIVLGWLFLLAALALAAVLAIAGHGPLVSEAWRNLALGFSPLLVVAAASLAAATVSRSSMLASMLTLGLTIAGQLAPVISTAERAGGHASWLWRLLDALVPNLAAIPGAGWHGATYAAAYAVAFVLLASVVFSRREL